MANIQDGTYDFVGRVITAFRAPGVTRNNILAFQAIAEAVDSGKLSEEDAAVKIAQIGASFAGLWKWINGNSGALSIVLGIIAIYLTVHYAELSIDASEQQHTDAAHQHQVIERQIEAIETETQVQRQIYEILQKQNAAAEIAESPAKPMPQMQQAGQQKKLNRHERRKSESLARRQSRS